jgi:hypothetical protein
MLPEYLSLISGSDYNVRKGKKESDVSESVAPSVRHQRTSLYLYAQDINFYTTENVTLWLYSNLFW